jgi:hypothetical protein
VPSKPHDAKYWLDRAEEAAIQAEHMVDPNARRQMLEIAAGYRRLAKYADQRTGGRKRRD